MFTNQIFPCGVCFFIYLNLKKNYDDNTRERHSEDNFFSILECVYK